MSTQKGYKREKEGRGDERRAFSQEFSERLRKVINDILGKPKGDIAVELGTTRQALYHYIKKDEPRLPDVYFLYRLHKVYPKLSIKWLLTGSGKPEEKEEDFWKEEEHVFVPLLERIILVGEDKIPDVKTAESFYPFKKAWLISKAPDNIKSKEEYIRNFFIYRSKNNEMSPTINEGEIVLMDSNPEIRISPHQGCIYLVKHMGTEGPTYTFRKVVKIDKDDNKSTLVYISDKPGVVPFMIDDIPKEKVKEFLIGKVIWVGRELACSDPLRLSGSS